MRRKRPDASTRRHVVPIVGSAAGRVTLCSTRTIETAHLACVAAGFILLFSRIEYGQSGTVFAGLWQQEEAAGEQTSAGHSAATLTRNKASADATAVRITY